MSQTANTEDTIDLKELFFFNYSMETDHDLHIIKFNCSFIISTDHSRYL